MEGRRGRRAVRRTEERVFPASRRMNDRMLAEHWARYRFVGPLLGGRLLDLACGTGYGARELARTDTTREVVGIDSSAEALSWGSRYYAHPKVGYRKLDVTRAGWESSLGLFDGIVAFEVLEHLADEAAFWLGVEKSLAENGTLWLSTPLGRGRGRAAADPFHVHQLRRSEVEELFSSGWTHTVYGQTGEWIEPWVAGRRYYTILIRARRCP